MDHITKIKENLGRFKALKYSQDAVPQYELLSDGLTWADEIPDDRSNEVMNILRILRRYRIVRLQPDGGASEPHLQIMEADWTAMKKLCPSWPGFRSDRCENPAILEVFEQKKREFSAKYPLPDW